MLKKDARTFFKLKRSQVTLQQIEDDSLAIANSCLKLPIWNNTFFHLFLPIVKHQEINTEYLLHILQGKDKHVVLSKSNFKEASLTHYLLTDATKIKTNQFGIPEPVEGIQIQAQQIDVVFVPLLACDQNGNRVGYGKGFYDKFLAECKPETIKIGLSFFEPISRIDGITAHDIRLDYLVTPCESYRF